MVKQFNSYRLRAMRTTPQVGQCALALGRPVLPWALMSIALMFLAGLEATVVLADAPPTDGEAAAESAEAHIPDPLLRQALEEALGKEPGGTITQAEIAAMEDGLTATGGVADLTGLEHATGITVLRLNYNAISDLSPLANLTNLTWLELRSNAITDLSPLAELTNLTFLSLVFNSVGDLLPLAELTGLEGLYLSYNAISDISTLGQLNNLTGLSLGANPLTDISTLSNLTNMEILYLYGNSISDLAPLSGLTRLWALYLDNNSISDLSPLSQLTDLLGLDLGGNSISDLSPLGSLTNLQSVSLRSNLVSDLGPMSQFQLPYLTELDLNANQISDLSPLIDASLILNDLHLADNSIADVSPLLENADVTSWVYLQGNPLSQASLDDHIPALQEAGVSVHLEADDHGDDAATATPIAFGGSAQGAINPYNDIDYFRLNVNETVASVIFATGNGDVELALFDSTGKQLAPSGFSYSDGSRNIRRRLVRGTYFIQVRGYPGFMGGGYVINATDAEDVEDAEVTIPDANLRAALEEALGKAPGESIPSTEMAMLTQLMAEDSGIRDLTGLEHATNLKRLKLGKNRITDLSPLAGLNSLAWELDLHSNAISDISPLAGLTHLAVLNLKSNEITDLSPLAGLTDEMEALHLDDNAISDLSPLTGFTGLDHLGLTDNRISDLSPLAAMVYMEGLGLDGNQITDISPLAGLTDLEYLGLNDNKVADLSALADLTRLQSLYLNDNLISDLQPLARMTWVERLYLRSNAIVDVSALADLKDLEVLDLGENEISDMSALANLTALEELYLDSNQIEHISSLAGLQGIHELHLHNNRIREVTPLIDLSNSGRLRGGTITLWGNPLMHRSLAQHLPELGARAWVRLEDDHGNSPQEASSLAIGGSQKGVIARHIEANDVDAFRLEVTKAVKLKLFTSGALDTSARLLDDEGNPLDAGYSADGGQQSNFIFDTRLEPGTYTVEVTSEDIGGYILHALDAKPYTALVPLLLSASHPTAQGFVRIINHSAESGTVRLYAQEDNGWLHEPLTLNIGGRQAKHFNAYDLSWGNRAKGIVGLNDLGFGDWMLHFSSDLDIEALAYARTQDGFLTSVHDAVPVIEGANQRVHQVATFNPGSNWRQVSRLQLINPDYDDSDITIAGYDDLGQPGEDRISLNLPGATGRQMTAEQLEAGDLSFRHRLGDGDGKWRLDVSGPRGLRVMSLMESPTGHLTNLSSVPPSPANGIHRIPLFPSASDPTGRQGFLRVINRSDRSGTVTLTANDESLGDYPPIRLSLEANQVKHVNSQDLEHGNSSKGLSGGIGAGVGDWRLTLSSEDLDIQALAYIRMPDGFLTSIHDVVPSVENVHRVAIFNPASNWRQVSLLRIINDGTDHAPVTIEARDDAGRSPGTPVRLGVPGGSTRTLTAEQLESGDGDRDLEGALGDGAGKWRLTVTSSQPISVMSLMQSPKDHLTNLSTAPRPTAPD